MERKKNNMNFYMNKNDILNTDQLDDKNVVIGYQKSGYDINDDKDEYDDNYKLHNKKMVYDNYEEEDYEEDLFSKVKSCFKNFNIIHVSMSYYPFFSSQVEQNYEYYYLDVSNFNILKCPACCIKFDNKIYVMNNKVILCSKCYNSEKLIYYI
jgi:hypothetical protein